MPALAYDPQRLAPLRASAAAALVHLLDTASPDPAATCALRVAAGVRAHLEHDWLAAVDRLIASDAMLGWTSTAPSRIRRVAGSALGVALAERATEVLAAITPDDVADLADALHDAAGDEAAMAAFFEAVDPDELMRLVTTLAMVDTDSIELPLQLRDCFARTAAAGGLPADYGRDLVRAAVRVNEWSGPTGDAGLALSFLFHGATLPDELVVAAVHEAVAQELDFAAELGYDPTYGCALWLAHGGNSARGLWLDFDEPQRGDDLDADVAQDPMYVLLDQIARDGNGAAGRMVFTDPELARYLLDGRDVLADGARAITAAVATASAGPDVVAGSPPQLLDDASLVASAFVNLFGRNNAPRVDDEQATTAAATILGAHMYALQHATGSDSTVVPRDRVRSLGDDDRDAVTGAEAEGGVATLDNRVFADGRRAAVFDPVALDAVIDLAARTDASVEVLLDVLSGYQQGLAAASAARLAGGAIERADIDRYLAEVTTDSGRLEGTIVAHVGNEARRRGRDADQVWSFWIGAVGDGVTGAGGMLGPVGSALTGAAAKGGESIVKGQFADALAATSDESEALGNLAGERLTYMWLRELQAAGLIEAALPPGVLVDGRLPSYEDLVVALATGGPAAWEVTTVIQQFDESDDGLVDVDGPAMLDAVQAARARHVEPVG